MLQVCTRARLQVWFCAGVRTCSNARVILCRCEGVHISIKTLDVAVGFKLSREGSGNGGFSADVYVGIWKCRGICVEKAVFKKNRKKELTFLGISRRIMKTNAMLRSDPNVFKIANEHRACLGSKLFLLKNRVWFSVYQGLWEFSGKFSCEKSPAQFAFGFGVFGATARLGRNWGEFTRAFPFEGN